MTWIGELDLSSIANPADVPTQLDLLIVGSDGLSASDLDRVASRRKSTPVIAVGSSNMQAERTFGPKLTSRELKQAIRELVFAPAARVASPA